VVPLISIMLRSLVTAALVYYIVADPDPHRRKIFWLQQGIRYHRKRVEFHQKNLDEYLDAYSKETTT
jgi:hypothetical protein